MNQVSETEDNKHGRRTE